VKEKYVAGGVVSRNSTAKMRCTRRQPSMSVASNAKHKRNEPVVRFHTGRHGRPTYAHEVEILGPSKVIYSAHEPILPCGARLVIATEAEVRVVR
jgi:hypothetical protein